MFCKIKIIISIEWFKDNCPQGKLACKLKTNPNSTPNPNRGGNFPRGNCLVAPNPKTNPNLNLNPNPNRGAIFLGEQLSGYRIEYVKPESSRSVLITCLLL